MQWSKLKTAVESFFAPSVAGRVELRTTNYRRAHDEAGRGWITIDGKETHSFCSLRYLVEHGRLRTDIQEANAATDYSDPRQRDNYYDGWQQATEILRKRGIVDQSAFEQGLKDYLSLGVEEALSSDDFVKRSLAVLDRRLGKRRLKTLALRTDEHPLVHRLFRLRLEAEGLEVPERSTEPHPGHRYGAV